MASRRAISPLPSDWRRDYRRHCPQSFFGSEPGAISLTLARALQDFDFNELYKPASKKSKSMAALQATSFHRRLICSSALIISGCVSRR